MNANVPQILPARRIAWPLGLAWCRNRFDLRRVVENRRFVAGRALLKNIQWPDALSAYRQDLLARCEPSLDRVANAFAEIWFAWRDHVAWPRSWAEFQRLLREGPTPVSQDAIAARQVTFKELVGAASVAARWPGTWSLPRPGRSIREARFLRDRRVPEIPQPTCANVIRTSPDGPGSPGRHIAGAAGTKPVDHRGDMERVAP